MFDYSKKVINQIQEFLRQLSPGKKIAVGLITTVILGIIIGIFKWAGNTTWVPLMTNLNPEDSTSIIRVLREKHIPFAVDPSGKGVTVPAENLYELRLELATMGYPQSGVVGYELFDKQNFGTTSFVQKLNQKRALEGELTRTVNTIKGVLRSRVHLAIPQKSAFVEDQRKPTASVVVDLDPGVVLTDKQVYGIGNLVSRAVEGLDIADVVIMNSDGKVLSKNPSDPLAAATATQLDYQGKVQSDLEKRVEDVLSRAVGEGRIVAKVNADFDFAQVNETQTIFDPDGTAIVSVEKHNDNMNGSRPGPYGVTGNNANAPGQPPASNGEVKTETTKNNEVTNFKVPETVRRTTKATGVIRRMSVAIVVDSKRVRNKDKDGKVVTSKENWTPEKLKEFENIAAAAVGLDKKRGDTIDIKNIDFTSEDFDEAQRVIAERETKSYWQNMVVYAVIGLTILSFFLFVVRPFIKWITENTVETVDTFLPQTIEELEKIQKSTAIPVIEDVVPVLPENIDPAKVEGEMIKEKIVTLVDANPHKAALIIRDWLHTDSKKDKEEKKDKEKEKGKGAA